METRLRLDPDPAGVQGGGPPVAAAAAQAPATVTLSQADLQGLIASQTQLLTLQGQVAAEKQKAEQDRIQLLTEKGRLDEAVKLLQDQQAKQKQDHDAQTAALDAKLKKTLKGTAIANAIAAVGGKLTPGASKWIADALLLDPTLQVVDDGQGGFKVQTADYRTVEAHLDAFLAQPQNSLFLSATSKGGVGPTGGLTGNPPPSAIDPSLPLGERMVLDFQAKHPGIQPGKIGWG